MIWNAILRNSSLLVQGFNQRMAFCAKWRTVVPYFGTFVGEYHMCRHVWLKIGYQFVYTTPHGLQKIFLPFFSCRASRVPWYRPKSQKNQKIKLVHKNYQKMANFTSFHQILEVDTDMKTSPRDLLNEENIKWDFNSVLFSFLRL